MAKTRSEKEIALADLTTKLGGMKSVMFAQYGGLKVKEVDALRRELRAAGVSLVVAKRTLLRRALEAAGLDQQQMEQYSGGMALAFGMEDEVVPAKVIQTFSKTHPALALTGGILAGQYLSAAQAVALAKLPSREELLAKTVWTIKAPVQGFVGVLSGTVRSLLNVLNSYQEQKSAVSHS